MGKKKRALKADLDATRALLHHRWQRIQTLQEQLEQANQRIAELKQSLEYKNNQVQQLLQVWKEGKQGNV